MELERFILLLLRKAAIEMLDTGKAPDPEAVRSRIETCVGLYWDDVSQVVLEADSEKVSVTVTLKGKPVRLEYPHGRILLSDRWLGVKDVGR